MITLDKEWLCHTSISPEQGDASTFARIQTLQLKQVLVATGWSVFRSCDGVSVSASDLWTDQSKVVWGTGAHAWIVLTNSDFMPGFAFCIDCNYAYWNYVRFEACAAGYNADGSTTVRPTALGTAMLWNQSFFGSINLPSNVFKVLYTTDKQNYRVIVTNGGEIGDSAQSGYIGQAFLFEKPKQAASWWPTPFVVGRFETVSDGLTYANLTTSGVGTMKTVIGSTAVNILLGTIGVAGWPTRSGLYSFGYAYDGKLSMPPMYFLSDNAAYPGVLGIMYDAYPISPYHPPGMRYKTTTNARGLMKAGALALGCPYGPMVV
jgi:hypothetical protein